MKTLLAVLLIAGTIAFPGSEAQSGLSEKSADQLRIEAIDAQCDNPGTRCAIQPDQQLWGF